MGFHNYKFVRVYGLRGGLRGVLAALVMTLVGWIPATALAGSFDLGADTAVSYKLTLGYGVAMRTEGRSGALVNAEVNPLQLHLTLQDYLAGRAFDHTGLSNTINFDDGDRNFKAGSLVNNRVSGLAEIQVIHKNYGIVASGDGFYDQVYHHPNDNNSPETTNKTGPNNHFSSGARYYDGQRVRLLEAYGFADWSLGGESFLNVRAGKQLVAYGESLFFGGISNAQAPNDATKAFIPGAEVKDILLPLNQVSFQLGVTNDLSLVGTYQLNYHATEVFPVGDFYSIQDEVGPGGQFAYGSINPLNLDGCPGLLKFGPIDLSGLCNLGGIGGTLFNAPATINTARGPDIKPSNWGHFAVGLKYQLTPVTNVGLFYLRYADETPAVVLNAGYPVIGTLAGVPVTTQAFNLPEPTSYQVKYFDGIHLYGTSFSTVLGPLNVAGEVNYRDGQDVGVQAMVGGLLNPIYSRAKVGQVLTSAIAATNPGIFFDEINIVGEAGVIHVFSVDAIEQSPAIFPVGNGDQTMGSRTAWGFQVLALPKNHNVFSGIDITYPISFATIVKGNPAAQGLFGPLYAEGDQRVTVGVGATYLDNLEVGVGYNIFLGDATRTIRGSQLLQHPYTDRDNVTFSIKYNL
ncbi:MAG: hypothetical protein JWR16_901 [Nevskia sp.]|nr:hypothetical protein [Nevskia sp.]